MSDVSLKLLLLGEDRSAGRTLKNVSRDSEMAAKHAGKLHSAFGSIGSILAGGAVFEGLNKGVDFLKESVQAAADDQKQMAILEAQIHNNTKATKEQTKATEEWLTKQSLATGRTKAELIPAFTKLVTATHSVSQSQSLLQLAENASAGTGKSLETVTMALVRAHNGNVGSLGRLGVKTQSYSKDQAALTHATIAVDMAQKAYNDTVKKYGPNSVEARIAQEKLTYAHENYGKAVEKSKKTSLSFQQVTAEMAKQFRGDQAKASDTAAGKMARLSAAYEEAKVKVGNALMPVLIALFGFMVNKGIPFIIYFAKQFTIGWNQISSIVKWVWHNVLEPAFQWYGRILGNAAVWFSNMVRNIRNGWDAITNVWRTGVRWIVNAFLNAVGTILHAAANLFGWVPKLGSKLRDAASHFDEFRNRVNNSLSGIHDKHVSISLGASTSGSKALTSLLNPNNVLGKHATGGRIVGPGTGTSDSIVARVSNGEYVVNAAATSRHLPLLERINRGYKAGGLVGMGINGMGMAEHKIHGFATHLEGIIQRLAQHVKNIWTAPSNPMMLALTATRGMGAIFGGGGAGVARWTPYILQVLKMLGQSSQWLPVALGRMAVESGGNPGIVNRWDSNWRAGHPSVGLMQVIAGTFARYAGPFRNVGPFEYGVSINPLANIYAGANYALHTYGVPFVGGTKGYANGGRPPVGQLGIFGHGPEMWVPDHPGRVLSASQTVAALQGSNGVQRVQLELVLDGRVIQKQLLTFKRVNGGLALGLA